MADVVQVRVDRIAGAISGLREETGSDG